MNYDELVVLLDSTRCAIQKGESTNLEGGMQQLLYEAEEAIIQLRRELDGVSRSRSKHEDLFHEVKSLCNTLASQNEEYKDDHRIMMRVIEHFLDE